MLKEFSSKSFRWINYFNAIQSIGLGIGWTFIFLFFYKKGFTNIRFSVFFIVTCAAAVLMLYLLRKISFREYIFWGNIWRVLTFVAVIPLVFTNNRLYLGIGFYLIALLWGASFAMFWVPFNILVFSHSNKDNKAGVSSIYFALPTLLSIFTPGIAGFIAAKSGYVYVFIASGIIMAFATVFAYFMPKETYLGLGTIRYDIKNSLASINKVRLLVFLEGIISSVSLLLLPVLTIYFFSNELGYGMFFSLINLISAFAMLFLAKMSDKKGKRAVYLFASGILFSLFLVFAAFTKTSHTWFLLMCGISFVINILYVFFVTVTLDVASNVKDTFIAREFLLNCGRILGGMVMLVLIIFGQVMMSFLFFALAVLLYLIWLKKSRIYSQF